MTQLPTVFICYSSMDTAFKDELVTQLHALERAQIVGPWHDGEIAPGTKWRPRIDQAIKECKVAILLVSANFLNSDFINSVELQQLLERRKTDGLHIIPVIIKYCNWESNADIESLQVLPDRAKPIENHGEEKGDRDKAWVDICKWVQTLVATQDREKSIPQLASAQQPVSTRNTASAAKLGVEKRLVTLLNVNLSAPLSEVFWSDTEHETTTQAHLKMINDSILSQHRGEIIDADQEVVLAIFRTASDAVSAALAIQAGISQLRAKNDLAAVLEVRVGLHIAEIPWQINSEDRLRGRHRRVVQEVTETADDGQILLTSGLFDAIRGTDIGVPKRHVRMANHGEYSLKTSGIRELHEVSDARIQNPKTPQADGTGGGLSIASRLQTAGYRVINRIGQGGMGIVYKAELSKEGVNELVAIKVLGGDDTTQTNLRNQFVQEADTIKSLSHPGIVKIHETVKEESPPYFVMDWISGDTVDLHCHELDLYSKIKLFVEICKALEYAHDRNIVHGDLKPNNIIISSQTGQPVLLDFGLCYSLESTLAAESNITLSGVVGTPHYMAPEQFKDVTCRNVTSDVYALGIILFEILTGNLPFDGQTISDIAHAKKSDTPKIPRVNNDSIPEPIQRICLASIEKAPEDRYQSIAAMRKDLEYYIRRQSQNIKIRPRVYNNLIEAPASEHVSVIRDWHKGRLVTDREFTGLVGAYSALIRHGISAISESRLLHTKIVILYIAGLLFLNGFVAWIVLNSDFWIANDSWGRVVLGAIPALIINLLWIPFNRRRYYRIAFVLSVLGAIALPFAFGVTVHEVSAQFAPSSWQKSVVWWEHHESIFSTYEQSNNAIEPDFVEADTVIDEAPQKIIFYNWELLIALSLSILWSSYLARSNGTRTIASLLAVQIVLFYLVFVDFFGLRTLLATEHNPILGLFLLPLGGVLFLLGGLLKHSAAESNLISPRPRQAVPFLVAGLVIVFVATQLLAINGPERWLGFWIGDDNLSESRKSLAIGGTEIVFGLVYIVAALLIRRIAPIGSAGGYLTLLLAGFLACYSGLLIVDTSWVALEWQQIRLYGTSNSLPPSALALLIFAVTFALLSVRLQTYSCMVISLVGTTIAYWWSAIYYLQGANGWPQAAASICFIIFIGILCHKYFRGDSEDIDDVGERLINSSEFDQ